MGKIKQDKFIEACKSSGGIITLIAKRLGVSRHTVYKYIQNPNMMRHIEDAEEEALDIAQSKIINSVNMAQPEGSMEDVKWFLSRKGRKRGWGENNTIINNEMNIGPTYKFIIERPDDNRNEMEAKPKAVISL